MASETFGFTEVTAGRNVGVETSADSTALLGIEGTDSGTTPKFTNNTDDYEMDVELSSDDDIELDIGDNGEWRDPPESFSLDPTESKEVGIRFVGECTDAGSATLDVDSELETDGSESNITISLSREFEISQSGQVQFSGEANAAGRRGRYEFELENTGCEDVTFTGIGINETSTDAVRVSGDGSLNNLDTDEEIVTEEIPIDNSDPNQDTRRDMEPTVTLPVGETVRLELDRFQRSGQPPNINMEGEDVRTTLYYGDGSSSTLKLCLDECDF